MGATGQHARVSGRLRSKGAATETTLAREMCREAGATVRRNVKLRDMNLIVEAADERSIEVLACGLSLQHGAQLGVDITLLSALTSAGIACPNAATPCCIVRVGTKRRSMNSQKVPGVTSLSSPSSTASLQHGLVQPCSPRVRVLGVAQEVGQDVGDLLLQGVWQFAHLVTG